MKKKSSGNVIIKESEPGIKRNVTLHRYTEENSPFIKRKMNQARAILSKYPLPDFEQLPTKREDKK